MTQLLETFPCTQSVTAYYPRDDDGIARQLLENHEARRQYLNGPIHRDSLESTVLKAGGMLWDKYLQISDPDYAIFLRMNCLVLGRFIQVAINKQWETPDLPRQADRRLKAQIEAEAQLWKAAFKCLQALNSAHLWRFGYPHCDLGQALLGLILDQQLMGWAVVGFCNDVANVKQFVSKHQRINADLKAGRNNMPPNTISGDFVVACLEVIETRPLVEEAWLDFLKARSNCLEHWRKQGQRGFKQSPKPGKFAPTHPRKSAKF